MKLGEKLRQAGERSMEFARQEWQEAWQEAKENIQDVQRRIRQRMRVFPRQKEKSSVKAIQGNSSPITDENASIPTKPPYQGMRLKQSKPLFSGGSKGSARETDSAA